MMKLNTDREWLKRMAEKEDGDFVSVGGWVGTLEGDLGTSAEGFQPMRSAFGRLVQLTRREKCLTMEEIAERADVDLADLMRIEQDTEYTPTPRTVHRVAQFLDLPEDQLMALAGHRVVDDPAFRTAALRFAARSEAVYGLSRAEHAALEEYVRFLIER